MTQCVRLLMTLCVMASYVGSGRANADPPATPVATPLPADAPASGQAGADTNIPGQLTPVVVMMPGDVAPVAGRLVPNAAWVDLGQRMANAEASRGVPAMLVTIVVVGAVLAGGAVGFQLGRSTK